MVQGELSVLWKKSMGNTENISKRAVPRDTEAGQTLDDYTLAHHEKTEKQNLKVQTQKLRFFLFYIDYSTLSFHSGYP